MDKQTNQDLPNAPMPTAAQGTSATDYATKYKLLLAEIDTTDRDAVLATLPENISDETRFHVVRSRVTAIKARDRARLRGVERREVGLARVTFEVPKALRRDLEKILDEFKAAHAADWPKKRKG